MSQIYRVYAYGFVREGILVLQDDYCQKLKFRLNCDKISHGMTPRVHFIVGYMNNLL